MLKTFFHVTSMYNLKEYSKGYSKASRGLWEYERGEPVLNYSGTIFKFPNDNKNNTISFNLKQKIIGETGADGTNDL